MMMMFSTVDTRTGRFVILHVWSKYSNIETRLAEAVSNVPTLTERYTIIESILVGYIRRTVKPEDDPLILWARENIVNALPLLSRATEADRRTLAAIELKYGKDILVEGQVYDKEMNILE